MMIGSAYLLLIVAILFGVLGQLLLKYAMARRPGFGLRDLRALALDLPLIGGFLSYGVSTLLYFKVLANLDLSLAYPTVSLSYVMITLFSRKLFQEKVSTVRWAAILIICAGVALVGLGVK